MITKSENLPGRLTITQITTEQVYTKTKKNTPQVITTLAKVNGACEKCKERMKKLPKISSRMERKTLLLKLEFDQKNFFRPNSKGHLQQ